MNNRQCFELPKLQLMLRFSMESKAILGIRACFFVTMITKLHFYYMTIWKKECFGAIFEGLKKK